MIALLIALAHTIPVFVSRALWGKVGSFLAAIIMSFIAVSTGGSQYVWMDLLAIWLVFFLI
jgi:hypothetical protein